MARDQSCPSGLTAYKRKGDVPVGEHDPQPRRCDRCRFWHTGVRQTRKVKRAAREAKAGRR